MSIYNEDELVPPSWINQEFLTKVLKQHENNEDLEISGFDISPASLKGDHYASVMFRCKVSYKFVNSESIMHKSLIIKTLPMEENMKREMLMQSRLFETEIEMFSKTLPEIERILAECGEPTKLSAKLIYHALEPHKIIIFEDLCERGYDIVRGRYLTEDEIKAIYCKVAKLHAVSYMLGHSEDHELVTKYQDGIFSTSIIMENDIMANGINNFIDMLSKYEELRVYCEKVKSMQPDLVTACKKLYTAYNLNGGQNDIFVLNHGDFHLKNLMFKFDKENKMEDVIMVDYQISCYAPSNIDMTYAQYMMLSSDLRLKRHTLNRYYFEEFVRILKVLKYSGQLPVYSDFQIASIKYRHFAIFLISTFMPVVSAVLGKSADELKDKDTADLFENPDTLASVYDTPQFVNDIRQFMPHLLDEGFLD